MDLYYIFNYISDIILSFEYMFLIVIDIKIKEVDVLYSIDCLLL